MASCEICESWVSDWCAQDGYIYCDHCEEAGRCERNCEITDLGAQYVEAREAYWANESEYNPAEDNGVAIHKCGSDCLCSLSD